MRLEATILDSPAAVQCDAFTDLETALAHQPGHS